MPVPLSTQTPALPSSFKLSRSSQPILALEKRGLEYFSSVSFCPSVVALAAPVPTRARRPPNRLPPTKH